jgi:hypothetical protein
VRKIETNTISKGMNEQVCEIAEDCEDKPRDTSLPKSSHGSNYKAKIQSVRARVDCWNKSAERVTVAVTPPMPISLNEDARQTLPITAKNSEYQIGTTEFIKVPIKRR